MYKLCPNMVLNNGDVIVPKCIKRIADEALIPFDPANTDYQTFKKEVLAGAELQDAEGVVMTQADAFIATLP